MKYNLNKQAEKKTKKSTHIVNKNEKVIARHIIHKIVTNLGLSKKCRLKARKCLTAGTCVTKTNQNT